MFVFVVIEQEIQKKRSGVMTIMTHRKQQK